MKAILVATIGTRDLMFQISSGSWYNVGDDRMQDGDIIGEQAEVISDLRLSVITYRDLTKFLLNGSELYKESIKPVIIGKLIAEKADDLEKIYLIGTNQNSSVREREKDTLYACELIKKWAASHYPNITVEIIYLGDDDTNPSNFEQMFSWWRTAWRTKIKVQPNQPIWLCLKGGVGQTAEAGRVSGLSLYGDRIQFFEFKQNTKANLAGIPSDYTGPFQGSNYLWDRTQQQAKKLLHRYDYAGVLDLLQPYFQQADSGLSAVQNLVKAGIAWNRGEFQQFFSLAKSYLTATEQTQGRTWWWMAYEQAMLGVVRLDQQNTTEAMLHSYRSVEGALSLWAIATFPNDIKEQVNQYPLLLSSICQKYPALRSHFTKQPGQRIIEISLMGWALADLLSAAIPQSANSDDFKAFGKSAREMRNNLSHRLGGLAETEVFQAWNVRDAVQWQKRILNCINLLTGQPFRSLSEASFFNKVHVKVNEAIERKL